MNWLEQQFELSRDGGTQNLRPMEGLRGFAVFLVFLVHYVTSVRPWLTPDSGTIAVANSLHIIGNTGVDLFFVLSGYLIYGALISRRQRFLKFLSRRVTRIYPAFIAVFVIYIALSFAFPAESKIPSPAARGIIYLVQNFLLLPGLFPIDPMITVAWSLSYEMFYYLTIPAIIAGLRLRDRTSRWRATFFMSVAAVFTGYCFLYGGPVRLVMFISGILLYEALGNRDVPSPRGALALLALVAGLLCMLWPMSGFAGTSIKTTILFFAFFTLCLACFRTPRAWLPRAFSCVPLRWLGNMSYSYYLLHGLTLKGAFWALSALLPASGHASWLFWALLVPMFIVTLVPTAALFLLVERPYSLAAHKPTVMASELPPTRGDDRSGESVARPKISQDATPTDELLALRRRSVND